MQRLTEKKNHSTCSLFWLSVSHLSIPPTPNNHWLTLTRFFTAIPYSYKPTLAPFAQPNHCGNLISTLVRNLPLQHTNWSRHHDKPPSSLHPSATKQPQELHNSWSSHQLRPVHRARSNPIKPLSFLLETSPSNRAFPYPFLLDWRPETWPLENQQHLSQLRNPQHYLHHAHTITLSPPSLIQTRRTPSRHSLNHRENSIQV